MKKIIILISSVLIAISTGAQQLNLQSQVYFARLTANPALTAYNGSTNVYGFFRDQMSGVLSHPRMGGGIGEISLWNDRIGAGIEVSSYTGGVMQIIDAKLYYAQKIKLAEGHLLSVGLAAGMLQRGTNVSWADREVIGTDPNLNLPKAMYFDMNIGLAYQWKKLTIGFAIPNLLDANTRSYSNQNKITDFRRNYLINGSYEISIANEKFHLEPGFIMKINQLKQVGLNLQVMADYKRMLFLGVGYDIFGGMPVTAGVKISKIFTVAYTYQLPILHGVPFTPSIYSTHEVTVGVCFDKWMKKGEKAKDVAMASTQPTAYDSLLSRKASADSLSATQKAVDSLALKLDALEQALANAQKEACEADKKKKEQEEKLEALNKQIEAKQQQEAAKAKAAEQQKTETAPVVKAETTAPAKAEAVPATKTETPAPLAKAQPVKVETVPVAKAETAATAKNTTTIQPPAPVAKTEIKAPAQQPVVEETAKQSAASAPKKEVEFSKEADSQVAPVTGSSFVLDKLSFEGNGSTLSYSSYVQLDDLLKYLLKYQNTRVRIVAHSDNSQDEISGFRSQLRARAIVEYLHTKGIDYGRVSGFGMGPRKPIADNETEEGRAKNRRVEVEIK